MSDKNLKAFAEQDRLDCMWEHQSPTVPACNPHAPKGELYHPRYKGPYQPDARDIKPRKPTGKRRVSKVYAKEGKTSMSRAESVSYRNMGYYKSPEEEDYSFLE